jgi:SCP-2 sterol transfer family
MLPLDLPAGTTIESLVTEAVPALHGRLVGDEAPDETFTVNLRIDGRGSWVVRVRGRHMRVETGEQERPSLWMYTTEAAAERFLEDALGPRRFLPRVASPARAGGVRTMSDPRMLKRVAMASGRIELAVIDTDGARLTVVFGFGDAARRAMDAEDPDTVVEASMAALDRVMRGELGPDEAISSGAVTVRGSRWLAMQLALAVAPLYQTRR